MTYKSNSSSSDENTTDSMSKRGHLSAVDEILDLPENKTISSIAVISGTITITGIQDVTDHENRQASFLPDMNRTFVAGTIIPINIRDVLCDATGADVLLFWGRTVPENEVTEQNDSQP